MKAYLAGVATYVVLALSLFSAIWFVPDTSAANTIIGRAVDVLFQPFFGPRAILPASGPLLRFGEGIPAFLASGLLWGALFAAPFWLRRRRPA